MKYENFIWNPLNEDDPNSFPPEGEYVLLSFSNYTLPAIGRYDVDEDGGGSFYEGDSKKSLASYGIFVNAWAPLPENYKD